MSLLEFLKSPYAMWLVFVMLGLVFIFQALLFFLYKRLGKKPASINHEELKRLLAIELNNIKQEIIDREQKIISSMQAQLKKIVLQENKMQGGGQNSPPSSSPVPPVIPDTIPEDEAVRPNSPANTAKNINQVMKEMEINVPQDLQGSADVHSCRDEYNDALVDEDKQYLFSDKHKPIIVDVVNSLERRRRRDVAPAFETALNGDYWVIKSEDTGRTTFVVLPRFGLVVRQVNFNAGALGEVFDCPDYRDDDSFQVEKVVKPAVFQKTRNGSWKLVDKGRLMLRELD